MSGNPRYRRLGRIAAIGLGLAMAAPGIADGDDPPERVAMVDIVEGAAAAQPAGVSDWIADLANRPLSSGDKVWVDANSRAELHLGSTAIRLGADTGLQFLNIADRVAQLQLSAGSMNVRLRYLSPDETFEVDTPNSAISLIQAGEYRIDVNATGDVVDVAVWRGQAEIAGQTQSFTLDAQQQGEFRGAGTLGVEFSDLPPPDVLDQWAQSRDQREDDLLTANFMSRDVTGYADLDAYGDWQTDPAVGPVWVPQVAVGWAPYSQGYWLWVAPWGWTWIDAAPWGFAPFHYGRWAHIRAGWAWCPGQMSVRPVYAPALVAWGTGPRGEVAWTALGYNEIYRPSNHVSNSYLQRVNVTNTYIDNTTILDNRTVAGQSRHVNQAIPEATIVVTPEAFASARDVNREPKLAVASEAVTWAGNPIAPNAKSLVRTANSRRAAVMPPRVVFARPVVARSRPPSARGPAAAQQSAQQRVIVTSVPRAEAMTRPATQPLRVPSPPPGPSPSARESPASHPFPPPGDVRPGHETVPRPENRTDRPAVMPRPSPERPPPERPPPERPPPERAAPERAAPVTDSTDRDRVIRTERPPPLAEPPPARKEAPPAEPPHRAPAPERAPSRPDH